jgi:hypothetical protein
MQTIIATEQSVFQIRNILMGDEIIRKLLYIQTPAALTSTDNVTSAMVSNLVTIVPYVTDIGGIENSSQSNFIVIYPSYIDLSDDVQHVIDISIDIFVYKDHYILNSNKFRLNQLLDRVVYLLEDIKLSFAERFTISSAKLTNIDNGKTIGFLTSWSIVNGTEK